MVCWLVMNLFILKPCYLTQILKLRKCDNRPLCNALKFLCWLTFLSPARLKSHFCGVKVHKAIKYLKSLLQHNDFAWRSKFATFVSVRSPNKMLTSGIV